MGSGSSLLIEPEESRVGPETSRVGSEALRAGPEESLLRPASSLFHPEAPPTDTSSPLFRPEGSLTRREEHRVRDDRRAVSLRRAADAEAFHMAERESERAGAIVGPAPAPLGRFSKWGSGPAYPWWNAARPKRGASRFYIGTAKTAKPGDRQILPGWRPASEKSRSPGLVISTVPIQRTQSKARRRKPSIALSPFAVHDCRKRGQKTATLRSIDEGPDLLRESKSMVEPLNAPDPEERASLLVLPHLLSSPRKAE